MAVLPPTTPSAAGSSIPREHYSWRHTSFFCEQCEPLPCDFTGISSQATRSSVLTRKAV